MSETIFAVSSGTAPSAISIVRISGPNSKLAVEHICKIDPTPRMATVVCFRNPNDGELIDRGLLLWFPAPRSFSGEDCVEFHVHGGRATLRALFRALSILPDFRPAAPGEFTRRAFINGKMDLTEAEGLADVVRAETDVQLRQALAGAGGVLSRQVHEWRRALVEAMAMVAANIDFSDEGDVPTVLDSGMLSLVDTTRASMLTLLDDVKRGEIIRDGFCVVICGPPNAGKSSLLNAVAGRDVAIVSTRAGTTRDLIEVRLDFNGVPVTIIDTAGLREVDDEIENEGVRRAIRRAKEANLVLWVYDLCNPVPVSPELHKLDNVLEVGNKCDLEWRGRPAGLWVSAVSGAGIKQLLDAIEQKACERIQAGSPVHITRERHRTEITLSANALGEVSSHLNSPELAAEDLRLACRRLEGVIGVVNTEEVLGEVFSRFCIGK